MARFLSNKTVVATGAAAGAGLACARRFAQAGAHVVLADADAVRGKAVVREMVARGQSAIFVQADAAEQGALEALAAHAAEAFGGLDILLAAAGATPDARFRATLEAGREAARMMIAGGGGGVIINMAALAAFQTLPGLVAEAVASQGIDALTQAMAAELAPRGIRVNAVGARGILSLIARGADLEEMAEIAIWLAGPQAGGLDGQMLHAGDSRVPRATVADPARTD